MPSELMLNVKGVPGCIGVVGVPKTGDPETAVEKYIVNVSFVIRPFRNSFDTTLHYTTNLCATENFSFWFARVITGSKV